QEMAVAPSLTCLSKESFLSLNSTPKSPYAIPLPSRGEIGSFADIALLWRLAKAEATSNLPP
ncbi:hypothetical protein NKJ09_21620, partial [Mesorhizobium sp. M0189]|uniref:hypothetical protein n=1 Tax=Mesorhizobium sp. M0189 TaxID=2956909 RepID=UPI003337A7AC